MKCFIFLLVIGCALARYDRIYRNSFFGRFYNGLEQDTKIPPIKDAAKMARYIVHNSEYCVLSHITHQRNATGYPMGRVFSMSDGPVDGSTGTPYIYASFFDGVARDLKTDGKCGMTMSLVQGDYCSSHKLDPEDPRCAQVMLIGEFEYIKNNTAEWNFAEQALFSRHPAMKDWPIGHTFRFGKLNIMNVQIVDYFGGSKYPTVSEYYNATPDTSTEAGHSIYDLLKNYYSVQML